jgi:hypothetical protein
VVLDVAGPSWLAWDLAVKRVAEHARECPRAVDRWELEEFAAAERLTN